MKRLFDLFRRKPAPTVEAAREEASLTLQQLIEQQLKARGIHGTVEIVDGTEPLKRLMGGIKPPADPAAEGWTWDAWSKEMGHMAFPGWSPCRFAHRTSFASAENARFVFGLTRGPFGLWQNNFDVCGRDDDGDFRQERAILTCLTHLPTGMGMGIFKTRDVAAVAADTAIRACPQLVDTEYSEASNGPWSLAMARTADAWRSLGIVPADNAHAHDLSTGNGPYTIMGLAENLEAGKPEKLS